MHLRQQAVKKRMLFFILGERVKKEKIQNVGIGGSRERWSGGEKSAEGEEARERRGKARTAAEELRNFDPERSHRGGR